MYYSLAEKFSCIICYIVIYLISNSPSDLVVVHWFVVPVVVIGNVCSDVIRLEKCNNLQDCLVEPTTSHTRSLPAPHSDICMIVGRRPQPADAAVRDSSEVRVHGNKLRPPGGSEGGDSAPGGKTERVRGNSGAAESPWRCHVGA